MSPKKDLRLFHPKQTITRRMILSTCSVLIVLSVLLCAIYWMLASSSFSELETRLMENQIQSAQEQFNNSIRSADSTMTQIVRLQSLRTVCESEDPSGEILLRCDEDLKQIIDNSLSVSASANGGNLTFLNIYLANGYRYVSNPDDSLPFEDYASACAYFQAHTGAGLDGYISTTWVDVIQSHLYRLPVNSLVGIRFLYDRVTMEKVGVMTAGVRESSLRQIFCAASEGAFLIHESGAVLSAAVPSDSEALLTEEILTALREGNGSGDLTLSDGRIAHAKRVGTSPLWILYPMQEQNSRSDRVFMRFFIQSLLLSIFAIAAAILLMQFFSKRLTRSLNALTDVVRRIQLGDMTARFEGTGTDDISYLGGQINQMLDDLKEAYELKEADAAVKRNLELQLMQSQINPHLLYNTLNSVLGIIRQGDHKKAEKLILSLGSFFRLVLSRGNEMIPLSDELAMIRYYLEIQNLGREKAFTLETDVPEDLLSCRILRLTLQPFVENSVIHGSSDWREDGVIRITASVVPEEAGDIMTIRLTDNGIGILPSDLAEIRGDLGTYPPVRESKHFGMYNVERRIKDKFGDDYGVSIESEVGEYTEVTIRLPAVKAQA